MSFFIDTSGKETITTPKILYENKEESDSEDDDVPAIAKKILENIKRSDNETVTKKRSTVDKNDKFQFDVDKECEKMGLFDSKKKGFHAVDKVVEEALLDSKNVDDVLTKSVITPGFEKLHQIPALERTEKSIKSEKRREREKTKGKKWYGLPATELTEEVKQDLEVLQMRSVLNPKHFYKKNDLKVLPKYFQIGKVMDSPLDYYNNRCTKKERKKTLVDELLADAEFKKYNKRKYKEIVEEKQKSHYKAWKEAKKLKRKKKF